MLQRLTSETSSRETIEQPTTTPKGRPWKKGYSKKTKETKSKCLICGKKHNYKNCNYYSILKKNIAKYKGKKKGDRLCKICGYYDHTPSKCIPLLQTRIKVNE